MNDRREVVVRCFQVICLTNFFFLLSPSLSLTHTQTQKELWCFFCDGLFCSRGNMKHPEAFVSGQLHVLVCMCVCV